MADLPARDLSYEDFAAWLTELHLDVETVLREAGIGKTQKYVVKNRWGKNPKQMADLIAAVERIERRRIKQTPTGERLAALDEWRRIGAVLAQDMETFAKAIAAARATAGEVEDEVESPLRAITPEPKGNRK